MNSVVTLKSYSIEDTVFSIECDWIARHLNPCHFFATLHFFGPRHPRQKIFDPRHTRRNFIDPHCPRHPRQSLTHATHAPASPRNPRNLADSLHTNHNDMEKYMFILFFLLFYKRLKRQYYYFINMKFRIAKILFLKCRPHEAKEMFLSLQ